ncbi:Archaemetzincin-1 [Phytophthora pseudosyringae]|uniref:Archaemetzincin-1 n=1 Tax=Phytophthora pseudosyringae TaxID=221518 RepID=A0A8T1WF22_9STRA|nr:Archaemetzincin-1 [Phytophthora pseudosyringae]
MASSCDHEQLCLGPSSHAQQAGYARRTLQQLTAATRPSGRAPKAKEGSAAAPEASTFPAPLVLPGDELSWDPKYDAQSLKSWLQEPDRNPVADERKTVYVVPVPAVAARVKHVKEWVQPKLPADAAKKAATATARPDPTEVVQYLAAFYTNLPVKLLSEPKLQFTSWEDDRPARKRSKPSYIALSIGSEAVRIRARPSRDGIFGGQLNLDDILDAAIALLPSDAYALLLLVDHDLYEDEDDDFCCGRAYGGSRVAVVSSARYNPALDTAQEVEVKHAWPASHCQVYVDTCVRDATGDGAAPTKKKAKMTEKASRPPSSTSAMQAAIRAFSSIPESSQSDAALWLARFCRTASHELAHCFGIDHCVYYACSMQGSAGLSEDARQPPYLCPVDLAKMLHATGADSTERYKALLAFCERFEERDRTLVAFSAWLSAELASCGQQHSAACAFESTVNGACRTMTVAGLARNGVLIVGWTAMMKEYICDVNYGMGVSMTPSIPDGSFIFVERLSRRWRSWERGDLVQLRSPTRHLGETITKRILALEGDVVELQPRFDEERKGKITVPKGHVWVEGDNPTCSVDSRHFGAVPAALLIGRPFWII